MIAKVGAPTPDAIITLMALPTSGDAEMKIESSKIEVNWSSQNEVSVIYVEDQVQ